MTIKNLLDVISIYTDIRIARYNLAEGLVEELHFGIADDVPRELYDLEIQDVAAVRSNTLEVAVF